MVLLNCVTSVLEVCSTLAFNATRSESIRATVAARLGSTATVGLAAAAEECPKLAVATAPPIAPATTASTATAAIAAKRRLPDPLPELGLASTSGAIFSSVQPRSPGDMIISLPGTYGEFGLSARTAEGWTPEAWTSEAGTCGVRISGTFTSDASPASWSGTRSGASVRIEGSSEVIGRSDEAPDVLGLAGPEEPDSPLIGSAWCSLTLILQNKLTFW